MNAQPRDNAKLEKDIVTTAAALNKLMAKEETISIEKAGIESKYKAWKVWLLSSNGLKWIWP